MKRTVVVSVLGVVLSVVGVAAQSQRVSPQRPAATSERPQGDGLAVGRYQVIPTTDEFFKIILLDTVTGDTWTNCLDEVDSGSPAVPPPEAQIQEYLEGLIAADEAALGRRYSERDRTARRETLREIRKAEIAALGVSAKPQVSRKSWCVMPRTSGFGAVTRPK